MDRRVSTAVGLRGASAPLAVLAGSAIGRAATLALYDELALSPKPGLVTLIDTGSHDDMDARTFMRSLFALRSYFMRIAGLGAAAAPFEVLERCGIEAEARMLAATGGVNTHRGAIFTLGLLCAACGAAPRDGLCLTPAVLRSTLLTHWGNELAARADGQSARPGKKVARDYGLRSASAEAALGFPVLFETAVPAMQRGTAQGLTAQQVQLDTLFHAMAVLDDTNLARRGGLAGLRHVQRAAKAFLEAGGAARPDSVASAFELGRDLVRRRLSPGGAADMLAAAILVARLGALSPFGTAS